MPALWLCLYLPELPLDALGLPPPGDATTVVTAQRGSRRWVVAAREPARCGQLWSTVQTLHPELRPAERRPRAEREALQAVATWAWTWGSELIVEIAEDDRRDLDQPCAQVWVEIGASLKLYGGLDALLRQLDAVLPELGHRVQRGVAPTVEAAALLARCGRPAPVTDAAALHAALAELPLSALRLSPRIEDGLRAVGLATLGDWLALPGGPMAKRHGAALLDLRERLIGRRPDVRPRWRPPLRFERRFDLLGEVEVAEGLLFPVQRLARELGQYLRARDTGVQAFRLHLAHGRGRGGQRLPDTVFDLRLSTPARDGERLLRVLREQLARQPLPAPVRMLKLEADQFVEPSSGQGDLFSTHAGADEAWGALIERLVARLGADAVCALGLVDDPRPERAWRLRAGDAPPPPAAESLPPARLPARPIWLIDPPRPLPRPPAPAVLDTDAERIEGGWWDGGDVARDYYRIPLRAPSGRRARSGAPLLPVGVGVGAGPAAEASAAATIAIGPDAGAGAQAWVYRDRATAAWYLHGLWA